MLRLNPYKTMWIIIDYYWLKYWLGEELKSWDRYVTIYKTAISKASDASLKIWNKSKIRKPLTKFENLVNFNGLKFNGASARKSSR